MWTLSPRILRTLHPNGNLYRIVNNHRRITQLHRTLCAGSSGSDPVSKQNRRRALEYLEQYAKEESISFPDDLTLPKEIHKDTSLPRPSARELAQARLRKHIPVVTGSAPSPDQLAQLLESGHGAQNVVTLDVRHKASFADCLLLCCGLTSNHVLAIADGIVQDMRALDVLVDGDIVIVSGRESSDWMVVDVGSTVVHVMTNEARDHYRLEDLWLPERVPPNDDTDQEFR